MNIIKSIDKYLDEANMDAVKDIVEMKGDDVILKGISVKDSISYSLPKFKKEYPSFYDILREVYSEKEIIELVVDEIKKDINKGKLKGEMLLKLSDSQIKEQIGSYAELIMMGDMSTNALKVKNKWLAQKIQMMKK